jgi:hypothetical protein
LSIAPKSHLLLPKYSHGSSNVENNTQHSCGVPSIRICIVLHLKIFFLLSTLALNQLIIGLGINSGDNFCLKLVFSSPEPHPTDLTPKDLADSLPLTNVISINLHGLRLGDEGAKAIASALPNTRLLSLALGSK